MRKVFMARDVDFMGSHFINRLAIEGYSVRILNNFGNGRMENLQQLNF